MLAAEAPYGRPLRFPDSPRPYVVANFVASIDGVASLGLTDGTDSTTLSGSSRADRYLMGLLRASADAVMIGAGNLRATPGHQWTPASVAGPDTAAIKAYRAERTGAAEPPPLVVVSLSGDLSAHVALDQPATSVMVVTSARGRSEGSPRASACERHRSRRGKRAQRNRDRGGGDASARTWACSSARGGRHCSAACSRITW